MNPAVSLLAQWLEALLNGALSLDPVAEARLRRLDGTSFAIVSTAPAERLNVRCIGARLLVARGDIDRPHVIVTGTSQALFAALTGLGRPAISVEGDELLLDELRGILRDLDPDLAQPLAPLIGDDPAAALSGYLRAGRRALRSLVDGIDARGTQWMRAGLHERFAVDSDQEKLAENVTALRLAVDRLDARLRVLESRRHAPQRTHPHT